MDTATTDSYRYGHPLALHDALPISVDTAGHGGTLGLPTSAQSMQSYAELLGRVLDHLGVSKAVLVGHSMGGRLVAELAARQPERAIAVILLDAIVGDTWDRMVNLFRFCPPLLVGVGATLAVDTVSTGRSEEHTSELQSLMRISYA